MMPLRYHGMVPVQYLCDIGAVTVRFLCDLTETHLALDPFYSIRPYNYGLNAALAHNDGHISRLFVDCISYI